MEAFSDDEVWSDCESDEDIDSQAGEGPTTRPGTPDSQISPDTIVFAVGEQVPMPGNPDVVTPDLARSGNPLQVPPEQVVVTGPSRHSSVTSSTLLAPPQTTPHHIPPRSPTPGPDPSIFEWGGEPTPIDPPPFTGNCSLLKVPEGPSERHYFNLLFNDDFFNNVMRETEAFAQELGEKSVAPHARISNWREMTRVEFEKWLGLLFHMGHIKINRMEYYWNRSHMYQLGLFGHVMSRDRFFSIMQALHFAGNPTGDDPIPTDRLFKIRPLVDFFNKTMKEVYTPGKQLSLDESMVLWRGRLVFRQFIKGKKHKYGIKIYMITEPNGLVLRILIYEGAGDRNLGGRGHTEKVVHHLTADFLGSGHSLFTDNFYNSPKLTRDLLGRGMTNTGTLQAKRKDVPPEFSHGTRLRSGELIQRWTYDGICAFIWKDKRDVIFISSEFGPEMVEIQGSRRVLNIPKAISEYNKNMGGIDRADQLLSYYNCEHKSLKWYKKLGIHIFQMMLINSYLLHNNFSPGPKKDLWHFRHQVVDNLVGGPPQEIPQPRVPRADNRYHLPVFTKVPEGKSRRVQKRCRLCLEKGVRREVIYECEGCDGRPAFCLEPCFKEYHIRERLI